MNVGELKAILEDLDGDIEVRIMTQRRWPFESDIHNLVQATDFLRDEDNTFIPYGYERTSQLEDRELSVQGGEPSDVLYIVEGSQLGYGTTDAWV